MEKQASERIAAPTSLKRFQFSLRGMFWVVTLLTILIDVEVAIWRNTVRVIEANNLRTAIKIREINRSVAIRIRKNDERLYAEQLARVKELLEKHPSADVRQMQAQIDKYEVESKAKFNAIMEKLGPELDAP